MSTAFRVAFCASFALLLLAAPAHDLVADRHVFVRQLGVDGPLGQEKHEPACGTQAGRGRLANRAAKNLLEHQGPGHARQETRPGHTPASDTWKSYSPAPPAARSRRASRAGSRPETSPLPRTVGEWMKRKRVEP